MMGQNVNFTEKNLIVIVCTSALKQISPGKDNQS